MRQIKSAAFASILLALMTTVIFAETSGSELSSLFPERLGSYKRLGLPRTPQPAEQEQVSKDIDAEPTLEGIAEYTGGFRVQIVRYHQDADAYAALTIRAAAARKQGPEIQLTSDFGTASFIDRDDVAFFKGLHFVRITGPSGKSRSTGFNEFARALSDSIDKGEAEIPPLVKHLPDPEEAQKTAIFVNRFSNIQFLAPTQTVLSAVQTDRDADAAFVDLPSGKVLIVEYHTPQLAKENDERVIAKIHELWNLGQLAPAGYKRVGNYSVFVFDAPNEATAKVLISEVKYEQIVQWLGRNPYIYQEAERRYVETTLGVFVAVVKASGFALVGCVGLGGLIGALLFTRRRSQQRAQEAYSDAGGMLRLNIDELTPETDPARLLGPGR